MTNGTAVARAKERQTAPARKAGAAAARKPRKAGLGRGGAEANQWRPGYLFLSPWILGMAFLTIGPMLISLWLSFTDADMFTFVTPGGPDWIGLDNYTRMVQDPIFLQSVKVTLTYVVIMVPLELVVALAVAMLLSQGRRGMGFYRSAFYAPSLIGASVGMAIVWRALFSSDGVVDSTLSVFGIHTGGWIGNPSVAVGMLILLGVWQFGAPMVIFLAGLTQVPKELLEAAEVDGAGAWRRFTHVSLPLITPVIFFNLVLETIRAFQVFTAAFIISNGNGGPARSTLFYTLHLYHRAFEDLRMGYASAMAWLLVIVVGLITMLLFRTARGWVHYQGDQR